MWKAKPNINFGNFPWTSKWYIKIWVFTFIFSCVQAAAYDRRENLKLVKSVKQEHSGDTDWGTEQTETHLPAEDGTPWWGCSCQSSSAWWRIWVHSILSSRNIVMMASRVVTASVMMNWNMKISLVVSSRNTSQTWMRIEKANRCQICPNLIPFQLYTATRYKSPLLVWSSRLF